MNHSAYRFAAAMLLVPLTTLACGSFARVSAAEPTHWLGIACRSISPELRAQTQGLPADEGLLIYSVAADGPAQTAGVRQFDILLAINGAGASNGHPFEKLYDGNARQQELMLLRKGERLTINLKPAPRPAAVAKYSPAAPGGEPPLHSVSHAFLDALGLDLAQLPAARAKELPAPYTGGVVVSDLGDSSLAEAHGMKKDDVLVALDVWQIRSLTDVQFVLNKQGGFFKFFIVRPGKDGLTTFHGRITSVSNLTVRSGSFAQRQLQEIESEADTLREELLQLDLAIIDIEYSIIGARVAESASGENEIERTRAKLNSIRIRKRELGLEMRRLDAQAGFLRGRIRAAGPQQLKAGAPR